MKILRTYSRHAGFTLVEMMIAMAISSLVMVAIASMQYIGARAQKEMYGVGNTRSSRMQSIDTIRFRLCNARVGTLQFSSACTTGSGFHQIEFIDPNRGGVTSSFRFDEDAHILFYDEDIADGQAARDVVRGPIDVSFESLHGGAIVSLKVKSSSDMLYADVDIQDGETLVYLRNT